MDNTAHKSANRSAFVFALLTVLASAAAAALTPRCGAERVDSASLLSAFPPGADVGAVLEHTGASVAFAMYSGFETEMESFDQTVGDYQAAPSEARLQRMREQWQVARTRLKETEIFFFGPANEQQRFAKLDSLARGFSLCVQPGDCSTTIEGIIAGSDSLTPGFVSNQGVRVRGLPTIEYLLWDDGGGDSSLAAVQTALTGRRLQYLAVLSQDCYDLARDMRRGWSPELGGFAVDLAQAGAGSTEFASQVDALSWIVQQMLILVEAIRDMKLGFPAGLTVKSNGVVDPEARESRFANFALEDMQAALVGLEAVYTGTYRDIEGPGFSAIVRDANPGIDGQVRDAITQNQASLQQLQEQYGTFAGAVQNGPADVQRIFDEMRTLRTLLAADLTAASGTNPGVRPNDGA